MSNCSSQTDAQPIGQYSTPQGGVDKLYCSLSSISDGGPSTDKRILPKHRYTTDGQDRDAGGIFGDAIREYAVVTPDIQSCDMGQLFHRTHDLIFHKSVHDASSSLELPSSREVLQTQSPFDDDLFDEHVGEHHRTYVPNFFREKVMSLRKTQVPVYSKADLLWEDFMKDHESSNPRKKEKSIRHFFTNSAPKFFKTRGRKLEQKKEVQKALPKKKKVTNLYFSDLGLPMPSMKCPLGWMAIKGICYAQRLEVCAQWHSSSNDSLELYEPLAKKKRSSGSTEYPSPLS